MQEFLFYIGLGFDHVVDFAAYDHILFLIALALPFSYKKWRNLLLLITVFTVSHCLSLALSAYEIVAVDVPLVEFLIPITIILTAAFNVLYFRKNLRNTGIWLHAIATFFFGIIHGLGFSNYFRMLMSGEEEYFYSLLGFATGIEFAQVVIVIGILTIAYTLERAFRIHRGRYILIASILVISLTIPMLISTFPW